MNAAIKWMQEVTVEELWKKEIDHKNHLIDILNQYEFVKIVGAPDGANYAGIVSCLLDDISSDSAGNIFDQQGIAVRAGLQCAPLAHQFLGTYPAGTIRFSVSYFTNDDDFDQLQAALDFIKENL